MGPWGMTEAEMIGVRVGGRSGPNNPNPMAWPGTFKANGTQGKVPATQNKTRMGIVVEGVGPPSGGALSANGWANNQFSRHELGAKTEVRKGKVGKKTAGNSPEFAPKKQRRKTGAVAAGENI